VLIGNEFLSSGLERADFVIRGHRIMLDVE